VCRRLRTLANDENSVYVSAADINTTINSAPDAQWRLIIALCRFGGLRCPSEVLRLKWADVDFAGNEMTIRQGKTKKRTMPILPELRPYLEDAFNPEDERCISKHRTTNTNLRKMFLAILAKAELDAWPRLFHNLRGSLETDLLQYLPIHVICKWLGNSPKVAQLHYLKITPEHQSLALANGVGQQASATTDAEGNDSQPEPTKSEKSKKAPTVVEALGRPGRTRTRDKGIMSPLQH